MTRSFTAFRAKNVSSARGTSSASTLAPRWTDTTATTPPLSLREPFPKRRSGCATRPKKAFIRALKRRSQAADSAISVLRWQTYCEERGYGVIREYTGHGVGAKLHEDPSVPNFGTPGRGVRLLPGMVIAIEPMITEGDKAIRQMPGRLDRSKPGTASLRRILSIPFAITADGPQILTRI